jgi:hypothetical protein
MTQHAPARRDPFRSASFADWGRAGFHALIALLFTLPMWIVLGRWSNVLMPGTGFPGSNVFDPSEPFPRELLWLISAANVVIWGVPILAVMYRWRQQIWRHPERPRSSLVRTYAYSQAVAIALALPFLCWFGSLVNLLFIS